MSRPPGVPASLGRRLVERLGGDCGVAAAVAALLLARAGCMVDERSLAREGVRPASLGAARRVLAVFEGLGWCRRDGGDWRAMAAGMPDGLPDFLAGAAAMRGFGTPDVRAEAVVTLPAAPCLLAAALPGLGLAHANLVGTDGAFLRVARSAAGALTVMTPFLNADGADWALDVLAAAGEGVARHLVVRERGRILALLEARRERIAALGITLFDYWVPSPGGLGTHETFHAKAVLADDRCAYVGSANLTIYTLRSLELGVLLEGPPVRAIAAAVGAAKEVSGPFAV